MSPTGLSTAQLRAPPSASPGTSIEVPKSFLSFKVLLSPISRPGKES